MNLRHYLFPLTLTVTALWSCTTVDVIGGTANDSESSSIGDSDTGAGIDTDTGSEIDTDTGIPSGAECATTYSQALACENFESDEPNLWNTDYGHVEVSHDFSLTGDASLHATTSAAENFAHVLLDFTPLFSGDLYFRAYYYFVGPVRTKLTALEGVVPDTGDAELNVDFVITDDDRFAIFNHNDLTTYLSAEDLYPTHTWFCLRGRMTISETSGATSLRLNGDTILTTDGSPTLPEHGLSRANFGISWSGPDPAELYVDNIVVDTSEIPCI